MKGQCQVPYNPNNGKKVQVTLLIIKIYNGPCWFISTQYRITLR